MKIYLVQHGEAVSKDIDPDRPLSDQGMKDVAKMAVFLESKDIQVDRILHSGKMRARQTAELFANRLLVDGQMNTVPGINPNDPVQPFARSVPGWSGNTMVVGHLPFMVRLVSYLLTGQDDITLVLFSPGSVTCLELDDDNQWSMCWMVRPELIK